MGNYADIRVDGEEFQVEYEVLSSFELMGRNDEERFQIASKTDLLEEKLNELDSKIQEINKDIYRLTNHADVLDYIVAVGSGIQKKIKREFEWNQEEMRVKKCLSLDE